MAWLDRHETWREFLFIFSAILRASDGTRPTCRTHLRGMPRRPVEMRDVRRVSACSLTRILPLVLLAAGVTHANAGGVQWPGTGVLREVPLEGSVGDSGGAGGAPRRAGAFAENEGTTNAEDSVNGEPPSVQFDVSIQDDLSNSRASMPSLPKDATPFDVRMDVVIPDTTLGAESKSNDIHEEFRLGKTLVWCQSFLLSDLIGGDEKMSVVAVEPLPGSPDVHHMHLHVCDEDSSSYERHKNLFEGEGDSKPLTCAPPSWQPNSGCHGTAWTFLPGQDPVLFPKGVGFTAGGVDGDGDSLAVRRVVLEVHYDRAHLMAGRSDKSGLRLWATNNPDDAKDRVGVLSVADPFARLPQNLPGGQKDVRYTTHCPPGCTKTFQSPMHVFASMTHAHLRARHVLTSILTPDSDGNVKEEEGDGESADDESSADNNHAWRTVVEKNDATGSFTHDVQRFEPANFTIVPGDALRTECRYDTSGDSHATPFGPATSQEMCMQVFLYYPKQPEFLCGYYSESKFWCGDAEGFTGKVGVDKEKYSEWCEVVSGVEGEGSKSCRDVEMANAVVSEKNAHDESVLM